MRLKVLHNGDDVMLAWQPDGPIPGCRGFAIYRVRNGHKEIASTYVGFENEKWEKGEFRPSTAWPVQKYQWTDYKTRAGDKVQYQIVPVVRCADGQLEELANGASKWSSLFELDPQVSPKFACYFNRGVVATQWVQRLLNAEDKVRVRAQRLDRVIVDYGHPRERRLLGGQLYEKMVTLLRDASTRKHRLWAALFELTDDELCDGLVKLGQNAYVVLADGAPEKDRKLVAPGDIVVNQGKDHNGDENYRARAALRGKVQLFDRMTKGKFLAHNKIMVFGDGDKPRWTWTGSTNWTPSGLCTQANNGILIDDEALAQRFRKQIETLGGDKNLSPPALATANSKPIRQKVGSANVTVWFTRTNKRVDLEDAIDRINSAEDGALFLMFQTGIKGSLLGALLDRRDEPSFFVHGVISTMPQQPAKKPSNDGAKHKPTHAETVANQIAFVHRSERIHYAPDLLVPFAIEGDTEHWFEEFVKKNGAHAIVHSKVIVLDPFGKKPTVMTGSHNMGTTASSANDENLVIIDGDKALAAAYAVNIMSIYNNYRWRYRVAAGSPWRGLVDNDQWQRDYYNDHGKIGEMKFWMK